MNFDVFGIGDFCEELSSGLGFEPHQSVSVAIKLFHHMSCSVDKL
jgi:hypothetical protein